MAEFYRLSGGSVGCRQARRACGARRPSRQQYLHSSSTNTFRSSPLSRCVLSAMFLAYPNGTGLGRRSGSTLLLVLLDAYLDEPNSTRGTPGAHDGTAVCKQSAGPVSVGIVLRKRTGRLCRPAEPCALLAGWQRACRPPVVFRLPCRFGCQLWGDGRAGIDRGRQDAELCRFSIRLHLLRKRT